MSEQPKDRRQRLRDAFEIALAASEGCRIQGKMMQAIEWAGRAIVLSLMLTFRLPEFEDWLERRGWFSGKSR